MSEQRCFRRLPNPRIPIMVIVTLLAGILHGADSPILVHSGQKIGFMGDSITAQGNAPDGYIGLVISALKVEGIDAVAIPAGVPGHTSGNMVGRVTPQILDKGADWMTLSCGVNDVAMRRKHGKDVDLENFKRNITVMVEAALAKKVGVVLLTPTPMGEDLDNENNKRLAPLVDIMRDYAKEKRLPLADVNAFFQDYLKTAPAPGDKALPGARLLADGVHPNKTGQALMAKAVLTALGVPAGDFAKIEKGLNENPLGKRVKIGPQQVVMISPNQYEALDKLAGRTVPVSQIVAELWTRALADAGAGAEPTTEQMAAGQARLGALVDAYLDGKSTKP